MDFDENIIIRYLLGDVMPELGDRIEERYLSDEVFFAWVEAIEVELFRDFARDALSPRDRVLFRARFDSSPQMRAKLETEVALADAIRGRGLEGLSVVPAVSRVPRWWRRRLPVFGLAAACVAGVAAGLVVWSGLRASAPVSVRRGAPVAVEVSFIVVPGVQRGQNDSGGRLTIPSTATTVRLGLLLDSRPDFEKYRAEVVGLSAAAGEIRVGEFTDLVAAKTTSGWAVTLVLPAYLLSPGDYVVRLAGVAVGGATRDLPSYTIGIVR